MDSLTTLFASEASSRAPVFASLRPSLIGFSNSRFDQPIRGTTKHTFTGLVPPHPRLDTMPAPMCQSPGSGRGFRNEIAETFFSILTLAYSI